MVAPPACEPGKDTFVTCAASSPLSAGSATAHGSAFARCHGSRLFTLRLHFDHKPAVFFSISPAMWKSFTGLARTTCPSRCQDSLCLAFRRHWLADSSLRRPPESLAPCWYAVATHSHLGNCDSSEHETSSNYLTRLRAVSYRSLPPKFLASRFLATRDRCQRNW